MASAFRVRGMGPFEKSLNGVIRVGGAKNAALQACAFPFLFDDTVTISGMPAIEDTRTMFDLLRALGVIVDNYEDGSVRLSLGNVTNEMSRDLSRRLRASVVLIGPLLARTGEVRFPHPGGCVIGNRPIDIFLEGFSKMGALFEENDGLYRLYAPHALGRTSPYLHGADLFLRVPSVTATQTFMMAAVLADGVTTIRNAALEPETTTLGDYLQTCGARISGLGTTTLRIEGTGPIHAAGRIYAVVPDRIEAGSFLILGALAADELTIENCVPDHLDATLDLLRRSGVEMKVGHSSITLHRNGSRRNENWKSIEIKTHEYPGFPTDLQAPAAVFCTQVNGESFIFETIFDNRLHYAEGLIRMGADINIWSSHRMTVRGPSRLSGKELHGPDIRAGLAYLIAATVANGESIIHNAYYIDRGYERIEERLRPIGLDIERIEV